MATEQATQENMQNEEAYMEDAQSEQENRQENYAPNEEQKENKNSIETRGIDISNFIHGLAVGLGIGCIATFIIVWISLFFTPRLPSGVTYENLLSIFIYPLIYFLAVGLIALTACIVREYYATKKF